MDGPLIMTGEELSARDRHPATARTIVARKRGVEIAHWVASADRRRSTDVRAAGLLDRLIGGRAVTPDGVGRYTAEVERRAVEAVLDAEDRLGHTARDMNEQQRNQTISPAIADRPERLLFLEVKGRIAGSTTVTVSRNEILTGLNSPDQYVLALVEISPHGAANDRLRYVHRLFDGIAEPHFAETSRTFSWAKLWALAVDALGRYAQDRKTLRTLLITSHEAQNF